MIRKNNLFLVLFAVLCLGFGFEAFAMYPGSENKAKRTRVASSEDILLQQAENRDIIDHAKADFDQELAVDADWPAEGKEALRDTLKKVRSLGPLACPAELPSGNALIAVLVQAEKERGQIQLQEAQRISIAACPPTIVGSVAANQSNTRAGSTTISHK